MSWCSVRVVVAVAVYAVIFCSFSVRAQEVNPCRARCLSFVNAISRYLFSRTATDNYMFSCTQKCAGEQPAPTTTAPTTTARVTEPPINRGPVCGFPSGTSRSRIVGGSNARECEYPFTVGVTVNLMFCGGSIISNRHILTAAHCLRDKNTRAIYSPSQVTVRVGSSQLNLLQVHRVIEVHVDLRHIPGINDFDVAVLTLESELVYSECVQPICLPIVDEEPSEADYLVATGWGANHEASRNLQFVLQKVTLPIVENWLCAQGYPEGYINEHKFCAGNYTFGGIDSCQGDSGGPLFGVRNNRYVLYGITSFGSGCAQARKPGVYIKVSHNLILTFIKQIINVY